MSESVRSTPRRTAGSGPGTATLDEVDIRAEFLSRPRRAADQEAEDRALAKLATEMAANPKNMLQVLAEAALQLCSAGTAGISLLDGEVFRWEAVAGVFAGARNGTMPRAASPCGVCIDHNVTQVMRFPDRCFPALLAEPRFVEAVLIPFHSQGRPVGTVWIVAHDEKRKFDASDERIVTLLSRFAAAGWQLWKGRDSPEGASGRKDEFLAEMGRELRGTPEPAVVSFSTRQTARILGMGEATVKRLADDGKLRCLTSSARGVRRFVPEQLVRYLRGEAQPREPAEAMADGDLPGALATMIEQVTAGAILEALLDGLAPQLRRAPAKLVADLLARASALPPEPARGPGTALLAAVGKVDALEVQLAGCVLRSHGYEVLQPTPGTPPDELDSLAERVRPEFSVLVSADAAGDSGAVAAAAQIARHRRNGTVCVITPRSPETPPGVAVPPSMTALGNVLRKA